ncbi:MAG: hypothetical protein HKN46_03300 [Acidimicrobiia bacterium]|nr:hypothetical protein [Acidimicrobiia bacterium]
MSSTTSSERTRLHVGASLTMLGAGAALGLLARAITASGPLVAVGWWAATAGVIWLVLAPPTVATMRDSILPGAFLALALGLAAYALDEGETVLLAAFLVAPLSLGPAVSGLIRRTMPPPFHLMGFAAGALSIVVVGASGGTDPGIVLAASAGGALTVVHLTMARTLHQHRVIAHGGGSLLVAGALLLAGAGATDSLLPASEAWLPLIGATLLGGSALPLVRVRLAQRLTPVGMRPHLPLLAAGAVLVAGMPEDAMGLAALGLVVIGAWTAGLRPSELTGAEAYRPGP